MRLKGGRYWTVQYGQTNIGNAATLAELVQEVIANFDKYPSGEVL